MFSLYDRSISPTQIFPDKGLVNIFYGSEQCEKNLLQVLSPSRIDEIKNASRVHGSLIKTTIITTVVVLSILLLLMTPNMINLGAGYCLTVSLPLVLSLLGFMILALIVYGRLHKKKDLYSGTVNSVLRKRNFLVCNIIKYIGVKTTDIPQKYLSIENLENMDEFSEKLIMVSKTINTVLDTSGLDKEGNGVLLFYLKDNIATPPELNFELRILSLCEMVGLPIICLGSIIYNIFRMILMPLYVLFACIKQRCCVKENLSVNRFEFRDAGMEFLRSFKRIITAPFYSTAMFFALIHSLIFIDEGRVIAGIIERDWNEDVSLFAAIQWWMPHKDWLWEGGFAPKKLGRNGFYSAGCMQPSGALLVENWNIRSGTLGNRFDGLGQKTVCLLKKREEKK